jgi:hypothetical protein
MQDNQTLTYSVIFEQKLKILTLKWQWIEGHQDDNVKFEDLDPLSQDNILADSLAKAHLNQLIGQDYVPSTQCFGDEGWSVRFKGKKLAQVELHALYSLLYRPTTEAYWMKKYQLSRQLIRSIDWSICGKAYQQLCFPQQRRVSKQATDHMAVEEMMQIWRFQETDKCPRCQAPTEGAIHVLMCQDSRADVVWKVALTKLKRWMTSQRTMPQLQTAILDGLLHWRDPTNLSRPSGIQDIRTAVTSQDNIGWYPFATGHMDISGKGYSSSTIHFSDAAIQVKNGLVSLSRSCGVLHGMCGSIGTISSTIPIHLPSYGGSHRLIYVLKKSLIPE